MEQLANYDPYSIKQIQFNANKVTKHTTLKSIIATLIILTISIFLSYNSIKNLWCPRSQLDISSYQNYNTQALQNFPVCIMTANVGDSLPDSMSVDQTSTTYAFLQSIPLTTSYDSNQYILALANGRNFACFQLGGYYLNSSYRIVIQASGFPDVYIKTTSYNQLIQQNAFQFKKLSPSITNPNVNVSYGYTVEAKKIKAQIFDSLFSNSDPQVIVNIQQSFMDLWIYDDNYYNAVINNPTNSTTVLLYSQLNTGSNNLYLVSEFIIVRENIATIIAYFLTWFTILSIIFQIIISPIVDWSYKMTLAKLIYQNQKLNKIETSTTSFFKFLLSKILCIKIFPQGILQQVFERLEKDMNILNIIKRQQIMRKLIKQNEDIQTINHQDFFKLQEEKSEFQYQNDEDGQGLNYSQIQILTQSKKLQSSQKNMNEKQFVKNSQSVKFSVQEDENADNTWFFSKFIKSFDIGQTSISLIANKGKGYGNKWNTMLTAIVFAGVLVFLFLAGFLTISTNSTFATVLNSSSGTQTTFTLTPNDFIVRMNKFSPLDKFYVNIVIIDQDFNIVQNITLLRGSACDKYRDGLKQTGTGWLCLSKNVTLKNNGKGTSHGVHFYPTFYSALQTTFAYLEVAINSSVIDEELKQLKYSTTYFKSRFNSGNVQLFPTQVLSYSSQNESNKGLSVLIPGIAAVSHVTRKILGFAFNLKSETLEIIQTQDTIWDLIQNSWGVVILCFTLLLSKITNYINVKERKKIASVEEFQGRSDIVSILTTHYKLQNSAYRHELESIGYFYKSRLPSQDLKSQ